MLTKWNKKRQKKRILIFSTNLTYIYHISNTKHNTLYIEVHYSLRWWCHWHVNTLIPSCQQLITRLKGYFVQLAVRFLLQVNFYSILKHIMAHAVQYLCIELCSIYTVSNNAQWRIHWSGLCWESKQWCNFRAYLSTTPRRYTRK